jgi:hypothetical protein
MVKFFTPTTLKTALDVLILKKMSVSEFIIALLFYEGMDARFGQVGREPTCAFALNFKFNLSTDFGLLILILFIYIYISCL